MDEMLEILVDFWEDGYAEFHGEFYDFPRTAMFPMPQKKINIFVGGSADVALRRAARFDGFLPNTRCPDWNSWLRPSARAKGAPAGPFQVFLVRSCFGDTPLEFGQIAALEQHGVTGILLNVWPYFDEAVRHARCQAISSSECVASGSARRTWTYGIWRLDAQTQSPYPLRRSLRSKTSLMNADLLWSNISRLRR